MYLIDESYRVLFLKNNKILTKKGRKTRNYNATDFEYEVLKKIYFGKVGSRELSPDFLLKYPFVRNNRFIDKYIDSPYEKTFLCFDSLFHDDFDYIELLKQKKVLVIGLGGVGACVINHLLEVGVQSFVIIDFDVVSSTNLNRQYSYLPDDIGKAKTECMQKFILSKNKYAIVTCVNEEIKFESQCIDLLNKYSADIVVDAADTPAYSIHDYIMMACHYTNTVYACADVGLLDGGWIILQPGQEKIMSRIIEGDKYLLDKVDCIKPISSSWGITNSLISDLFSKDLIYYLLGKLPYVSGLNKMMVFDFFSLKARHGK